MDFEKMLAKVKETVSESVSGLAEKIKGEVSETIKSEVATGIAPIDERLKKIEAMPIKSGAANGGVIVHEKLRVAGREYKLHEQGAELFEKLHSNRLKYPTLSQPEKFADYQKWMLKSIAALRGDVQSQLEVQKATDLSEGTDAQGGYAVPEEFQSDLITLAREKSFALQECTTINMSREVLKVPAEASLVSAAWIDEAGTITASNPTFGQVTLTAKKLAGLTSGISSELLSDSAVDIVGMLNSQFTYAIAQELDNQVLNGTGSPVSGILTAKAGYSVVMSLTNFSSISADNLSLMISKLSDDDQANAKFIWNRLIQHYLRGLKDTAGSYVFQKPTEGRPGTVYETPYIQSAKAPSSTGTSTAFVAYGNWKYFYLGRRLGAMSLDIDPYTNFATDQVRFRMVTRWGMAVADTLRFVRLVTGS